MREPWHGTRILVALVVDSGLVSRTRVLQGMEHFEATFGSHHTRVDWAVTAYDDGADNWQHMRERAARSLSHVRLVAVVNASGEGETLTSAQRRARGVHRRRAVTAAWLAYGEDYWTDVWLSDGDIAFSGFELGAFLERRACAHAGGAPLIVQPTLRQSTQCWPFNHNSYHPPWSAAFGGHNRSLAPAAVGSAHARAHGSKRWDNWEPILLLRLRWVESQSVLMDAQFLRWFYSTEVVRKVLELQTTYHVSWGTDALWCGAAIEYARQVRPSSRAACAVVTVPIDHDNTKSIGARGSEYISNGFRLLERAGITSPRCVGGGRLPTPSCAPRVHPWWSPFANQVCASRQPTHGIGLAHVMRCASATLQPSCARRTGASASLDDECDSLQPLFDKNASTQRMMAALRKALH